MNYKHILLSRTDSIGDVILTLPLAGLIKKKFPGIKISFLAMPYTKDVVESCIHVDEFIDWSKLRDLPLSEAVSEVRSFKIDLVIHVFPRKELAVLAKKAGIKKRLGTTGRIYNWFTCNMLVPLSRKRSDLHESLLNIKLAERVHGSIIDSSNHNTVGTLQKGVNNAMHDYNNISIHDIPSLYGFKAGKVADRTFNGLIDSSDFNLIIHPRSKGSAREWGIENYAALCNSIDDINHGLSNGAINPVNKKIKVFISGTKAEGDMLRKEGFFDKAGDVVDITGRFNLIEFINFIDSSDALIAGSTGPLHIASALGKIALGLYPPIKPMHPGRWAPIGINAGYVVIDKDCSDCRNGSECLCIKQITTEQVISKLFNMILELQLK